MKITITNLITALYLALFFFTPLIFSSSNSELFELPKMYFVYSLTIGIIFLHFLNFLKGKTRLFPRFYLTLPLLIFLITQAVSTFFSADVHTSLYGYYSRLNGGFLSTLSYVLLSLTLVNYLDSPLIHKIIGASLVSGFLVAAYGIAESFGIDKNVWVQDVQNRVFSTLGQPNWLAAYLCILLPLSIYKFLSSSRLIYKSYFLLLTSSFYLCLLFTKSKSGIIAALVSLTLYFILSFLKNRVLFINHKSYLILLPLIALSLIINNPIKDKIFPPKLVISNSSLVINNTLNITPSEDIRKIVWTGALKLWQQFPYFGTGPETFAYTYYWVRPASHNLTSEWDFIYNKAHNEYLNFLATTGTIGFIAYLLVITFIIIKFVSVYLSSSDHQLPLAIVISFVSILITNIAGFSVVITSLYFFLLPVFLASLPQFTPRPAPKAGPLISIFATLFFLVLLSQNLFYYLADITYSQAQTLDNSNKYQEANRQINISLSYRSDEPVYLIKAATISSKLAIGYHANQSTPSAEKSTQQAIAMSQKAITISPFNLNLWKERAQIYYYLSTIDTKYYSSALQSLQAAAKLAPTDAKTFYLLGQFYQNTSDTANTIKYYQEAVKLKANYDHALFALGQIYFDQKNYPEAKNYFQKVLAIAPANTDAQNYLDQIAKMKVK